MSLSLSLFSTSYVLYFILYSSLHTVVTLYTSCKLIRGAKQGSQPPLNFGWGVEHLSTPPDFKKNNFKGSWLPLN